LENKYSFVLKKARKKSFYKPLLVWSILVISLLTGYYFGEGVWSKEGGYETKKV